MNLSRWTNLQDKNDSRDCPESLKRNKINAFYKIFENKSYIFQNK